MLKDQDLNDLAHGLRTYFKYNKEGPATIQLTPIMARKLLRLLENLEEATMATKIDARDLTLFPEDELSNYVKAELSHQLAHLLSQGGFITYAQSTNHEYMQEEIQANIIVLNGQKANLN